MSFLTPRYNPEVVLASILIACFASYVALDLASQGSLSPARLCGGAPVMGAGICAMHYTGMAALDMAPGIVWDPQLVAASVGIAVYPEHGPGDKLMSHADAAMYAAKRNGGSTYAVFETHMGAAATGASEPAARAAPGLAAGC